MLLKVEMKNKKTLVRKKENMKCDEALRLAKINAESDDRMTWSCASKLRNDIFAVQNKQISQVINNMQLLIT